MTLYMLSFDNGLSYEDNETFLVGVFSTPEKRADAARDFRQSPNHSWRFEGVFSELREWETELDVFSCLMQEGHP